MALPPEVRRAMVASQKAPQLEREDLVALVASRRDCLSPVQRQIADHVLRNYHDVGFNGVAELARAAGVSPAGVVRFANSLGFRGYPELQRAIQRIMRTELGQGERFTAAFDSRSGPLWERILAREERNLAHLRANLGGKQLQQAVQMLVAAASITIVGYRGPATLARYLWYSLRKVCPDVDVFTDSGSVTLEELMFASGQRRLFVFIAFPRYSTELLEMASLVKRSRCAAIGITNNELSPLASLCEVTVCAEISEISFGDFYAAPIALLNALVAEVAARLGKRALKRLNLLDDLAAEHGYLFARRRRSAKTRGAVAGGSLSRPAPTG